MGRRRYVAAVELLSIITLDANLCGYGRNGSL